MLRLTPLLVLAATAACQQTITVQHPCTGALVKGKVVGEMAFEEITVPRVELVDGTHVAATPEYAEPLGWKCPELVHLGVRECDDYIAKYSACLLKMTPEAQAAMRPRFKQTQDAWKKAAATADGRELLRTACMAARDATNSVCP